ncbi:hypothetical protein KDA00_03270 [Candidatus Saccharibacteria bacterium]|nr:hypothetical protein [Candidatus Saccharibacteria bacterium]
MASKTYQIIIWIGKSDHTTAIIFAPAKLSQMNKTVKLGGIMVVIVVTILPIALVLGAIEFEQLKTTAGKSILVIGTVVLGTIGVMTLASSDKK